MPVVVAGYLAGPALSARWYAHSLDRREFEAFAAMMRDAYHSALCG